MENSGSSSMLRNRRLRSFLNTSSGPTAKGTLKISEKDRIRQGNVYGHVTGRLMMWILGNPVKIEGDEFTNERAIFITREVVRKKLSLIIFPEGTRSADGRLLPFKKGFVHPALQTGLPIVPIVLIGTHRAWRKGSLCVRPTPLTVKYLSPIRTDDWRADKIDEYIKMIHDLYVQHLPESQRPLALAESRNGTKS
ncbi:hypothetical protein M0R45_015232 [Rubus argutus]|uniref:Phospholipid/glycerol acyltransferase domain-containing protein n=1 Tax=Rubus argutus TaxID=59490 RepID=A0AAW1XPG6_RUBAR